MTAVMDPEQNIKVFIYDSIDFLANLLLPGTGIRVLDLVLQNVKNKLPIPDRLEKLQEEMER